MPTNAEIKALIETRVRAQRSHILHDGVAEILDFMVDNISAGPGGTPGIDDVLAVGQALTADREIDLAGHTYEYENGNWYVDIGANFLAYIQNGDNNYLGYFSAHSSLIRASFQPLVGDINAASVEVTADEEESMMVLRAIFNQGASEAKIEAIARDGDTTLVYEAMAHTFNVGLDSPSLFLDNNMSVLRNFNNTGDGNEGTFEAEANTTSAKSTVKANFNDGVRIAQIIAETTATTATLTQTGDVIIADLAGGGTTGLSIDNAGKIIRTP